MGIWKKMFAMAAVFSLIAAVPGYSLPQERSDTRGMKTADSVLLKLRIPAGWGAVKEVHDSGSDRVIVNIQDAHCDFEAQQNIYRILDRLAEVYDVRLIALEGAAGKVQNPLLSNFPDEEVKRDVSLCFMREGKLTGAEFLEINSEQDVRLFGVEDMRLYLDNLDSFRQSQPFQKEARQYFTVIQEHLNQLKPYIYNANLKKIDALKADYNDRRITFRDYVLGLKGLMDQNGLSRNSYPVFSRLLNTIKMEEGINFKAAYEERNRLIVELTETINENQHISELVDNTLNFKRGLFSASDYAQFLLDLAYTYRVSVASYPQFASYAKYIKEYESIAGEKLLVSMDKVESDLYEAFYSTSDQRRLVQLEKHLSILNKLVELKMLNQEIGYFLEHREEMGSDSFRSFIEKQFAARKLTVRLPAEIFYIDVYLPAWAKFYEMADKRDRVLVENTISRMDAERSKTAALVTGGFHSENMARIMREKGLSYVVIAPRTGITDSETYYTIIRGGKTPLDEALLTLISTLQVFVGSGDQEMAGLPETEQAQLKGMMQEKLETQVVGLTSVMAIKSVNDSGGVFNRETVKTEVMSAVDAVLSSSVEQGLPEAQVGLLRASAETAMDNVLDNIEQSDNGVIVRIGPDSVLAYNPHSSEQPVAVLSSAMVGDFFKPTTMTVLADAGQEKQVSTLSFMASKSPAAKGELGSSLAEAAQVTGSTPAAQIRTKIADTLIKAGVSEGDAQVFMASIEIGNVAQAVSGEFAPDAAKATAAEMGISLKESGQKPLFTSAVITALSEPEAAVEQLETGLGETAPSRENISKALESGIEQGLVAASPLSAEVAEATVEALPQTANMTVEQKQTVMPVFRAAAASVLRDPEARTETAQKATAAIEEVTGERVDSKALDKVLREKVNTALAGQSPLVSQVTEATVEALPLSASQKEAVKPLVKEATVAVIRQPGTAAREKIADGLVTSIKAKTGQDLDSRTVSETLGEQVGTAMLKQSPLVGKVTDTTVAALPLSSQDKETVRPLVETAATKIMEQPAARAEVIQNLSAAIKAETGVEVQGLDSTVGQSIGQALDASPEIKNKAVSFIAQAAGVSGPEIEAEIGDAVVQNAVNPEGAKPQLQRLADKLNVSQDVLAQGVVIAAVSETPLIKKTASLTAQANGVSGREIETKIETMTASSVISPVGIEPETQSLAQSMGVSVDTLGAQTEGNIGVAMVSEAASVTSAAGVVARDSGVSGQDIQAKIEVTAAQVVTAASQAKAAVSGLAQSIVESGGEAVGTDALQSKLSGEFKVQVMADSPIVKTASEKTMTKLGLEDGQKESVRPQVKTTVTKNFVARSSEIRTKQTTVLAESVSSGLESEVSVDQIKTAVSDAMLETTSLTRTGSQDTAKVSLVKLNDASQQLMSEALASNPDFIQVVADRATEGGTERVISGAEISSDPGLISSMASSGIDTNQVQSINVSVRKGEGGRTAGTKVAVQNNGDKIIVSVTSSKFSEKNQTVEQQVMRQKPQMEGVNLTEDRSIGGVLAEMLSPTKEEAVNQLVADLSGVNNDINSLQDKVKVIVIDGTFLATNEGKDENGVKMRPAAVVTNEFVQEVTGDRNIKIVIAVPGEMGVNAQSFVNEMGLPLDRVEVVDTSIVTASLPGDSAKAGVRPMNVKTIVENKFGQGNTRIHFISPESQAKELEQMQSSSKDVSFTLFKADQKLGRNQARDGNALITVALKEMLVGGKQMTQSQKSSLASAILATIKVDMSQVEVESLIGEPMQSTEVKTVDLGQEMQLIYVAPATFA